MDEKKEKLKLEDIKIESFVTLLDDKKSNAIIGATEVDTSCGNCDEWSTKMPPICTAPCSVGSNPCC